MSKYVYRACKEVKEVTFLSVCVMDRLERVVWIKGEEGCRVHSFGQERIKDTE